MDEIKENDESSDDDRESDRRSTKKEKWPPPIKEGESDSWNADDWGSYCARVKLAVLRNGPEAEKSYGNV